MPLGILLSLASALLSALNGIRYGRPLISLGILAPFSHIGVARQGQLIAGASAVIAANPCINFEAQIQQGIRRLGLRTTSINTTATRPEQRKRMKE